MQHIVREALSPFTASRSGSWLPNTCMHVSPTRHTHPEPEASRDHLLVRSVRSTSYEAAAAGPSPLRGKMCPPYRMTL